MTSCTAAEQAAALQLQQTECATGLYSLASFQSITFTHNRPLCTVSGAGNATASGATATATHPASSAAATTHAATTSAPAASQSGSALSNAKLTGSGALAVLGAIVGGILAL